MEEESGGGERGQPGHGAATTTVVTSTTTAATIAAAPRGRACSPREPSATAVAASGWSRVRRRFPRSATASGAALQQQQHHHHQQQGPHHQQQQPQHAGPRCRPRAARLEAREREWLRGDRARGCVRLHGPDGASYGRALLCTEATEAWELLRVHEQQQLLQVKHKLSQLMQVKQQVQPQQQVQQQQMKQELQQQQFKQQQNQVQQMLKRQTKRRQRQQHQQQGSVSPVHGRRSDEDNDEGEEPEEEDDEEDEEEEQEEAAARRQKPALYVRLVGHEVVRRLGPAERPLRLQRDFLETLGYADPWRIQEEGASAELASLFRLHLGQVPAAMLAELDRLMELTESGLRWRDRGRWATYLARVRLYVLRFAFLARSRPRPRWAAGSARPPPAATRAHKAADGAAGGVDDETADGVKDEDDDDDSNVGGELNTADATKTKSTEALAEGMESETEADWLVAEIRCRERVLAQGAACRILERAFLCTRFDLHLHLPARGLLNFITSGDTDAHTTDAQVLAANILKKMGKQDIQEKCVLCAAVIPFESHAKAICANGHQWPRCAVTFAACQTWRYRRCILHDSVAAFPKATDPEWMKLQLDSPCVYCDSPYL